MCFWGLHLTLIFKISDYRIVISTNQVHFLNDVNPSEVKIEGILISLSSEQSSKQLSTILICFCDNNKLKISELLFLAAKYKDVWWKRNIFYH